METGSGAPLIAGNCPKTSSEVELMETYLANSVLSSLIVPKTSSEVELMET